MTDCVCNTRCRVPALPDEAQIWLACAREPGSSCYNVTADLEIDGYVGLHEVQECTKAILRRHPILSVKFVTLEGRLIRESVLRAAECHERVIAERYDRETAILVSASEIARPFKLEQGPLLRVHLCSFANGSLLTLVVHHIVADGRSVEILCEDTVALLTELRRWGSAALRKLRPAAVQSVMASDSMAREYWSALLYGNPQHLTPSADLDTVGSDPVHSGLLEVNVHDEIRHRLHLGARAIRVSPAVALLWAWGLVLSRRASTADGIICMPFSARRSERDFDEIGLYARILPVRVQFRDSDDIRSSLKSLRDQVLSTMTHVGTRPTLPPGPDNRPQRIKDGATFGYEPRYERVWQLPDGTPARVIERVLPAAKYPIGLFAFDGRNKLSLRVEYDRNRYLDTTIASMLDKLTTLVAVMADALMSDKTAMTMADLQAVS